MFQIKRNHKYIKMIIAFLLLLCLSACSLREPSKTKPVTADKGGTFATLGRNGFTTPEEAIKTYLEGLKANDLDLMMNTFAIENYVEQYDFQAQLERLGVYTPVQEIKVPNTNGFIKSLNIQSRKNTISTDILNQYLVICSVDFDRSTLVKLTEDGAAEDFVTDLTKNLSDPDFTSLQLLGFISPADLSELYATAQNQKNIAKHAKVYGVDAIVSCVAVFELDGNKFLLCADAAQYNGEWFLLQFKGNISLILGIDSLMSGLMPLEPQHYAEIKNLITFVE